MTVILRSGVRKHLCKSCIVRNKFLLFRYVLRNENVENFFYAPRWKRESLLEMRKKYWEKEILTRNKFRQNINIVFEKNKKKKIKKEKRTKNFFSKYYIKKKNISLKIKEEYVKTLLPSIINIPNSKRKIKNQSIIRSTKQFIRRKKGKNHNQRKIILL